MKRFIFAIFILAVSNLFGQPLKLPSDSSAHYFKEIKKATKAYTKLWNKNLYHNILLVDPKTRQVYSNVPDTGNVLVLQHGVYRGQLPNNINIANTALSWSGKRWAMIMLPLPSNRYHRVNLLAHELFHALQPQLGFEQHNKESGHLDVKEGRIYLRLELEALKKAVLSPSDSAQQTHLGHALLFRKYRNSLFPDSESLENQLELNEGLAEFTGLIISGRNEKETKEHLKKEIDAFFNNPTYVRSFAYCTTPVYGYLLYLKNKNWNKEIKPNIHLAQLFTEQLQLTLPTNTKETVLKIADAYHGQLIFKEELLREERIKKQIAEYKAKLVEQPHFEISLKKMNVSFDPRNIIPLEDKGTVYPQMRIVDLWGVLEVQKGALMSPNWDKIAITQPTQINGHKVEGEGWSLTLTNGYNIEKEEKTGNYIMIKVK